MVFRLFAAVAAALTVSAGAAGAAAPVFTPKPCDKALDGKGWTVACGALTVDESRGRADSRRIQIPVAIVKAREPRPGQPPVVYLHGGPGGSALDGLASRLSSPSAKAYLALDQDWIVFDQRGAGAGEPSMDCPGAALTDAGPASAEDVRKIVACLDAFRAAGVDLSRYNAREVAYDVQDLRTALKLDRIDLYGGSYGTLIAATVQRWAPEGVRAVVQDSPWPPEGTWAEGTPTQVADALKLALTKCAAQADCAARYPEGQARLQRVASRWLAAPQTWKGKTYTHEDLALMLMDAAYFGAATLPAAVAALDAGDASAVAASTEERSYYFEGQHMTHLCKEELPFERAEAVAANAGSDPVAGLYVSSLQRLFDLCRSVDVGPPSADADKPVRTSIPTLFLVAELDPGCPPPLAQAAAVGYADSQLVVFRNATHGVLRSPCAQAMMRAFLRDPSKPVDRSCLPAPDAPFPFKLAP